jgi:small subunit ribosomal protein S17
MNFIALLVAAELAVAPHATLILDKVRTIQDPRGYDLTDPVNGDRGVPLSCALAEKTTVTLIKGKNATLEVTRDGIKKTIVVEVERRVPHPIFKKIIRLTSKFYAHDEEGKAKTGDKVRIEETRPLSRLKRWRVVSVVQAAVADIGVAISEQDVAETVPTKITKA